MPQQRPNDELAIASEGPLEPPLAIASEQPLAPTSEHGFVLPGGPMMTVEGVGRFLRGAVRGAGKGIAAAGQILQQPGSPLLGGAQAPSPADAAIVEYLTQHLPAAEGEEGWAGETMALLAPSFAVGRVGLLGEAAMNAVQGQAMGGDPAIAGATGAGLSLAPRGVATVGRYLRRSSKTLLERGMLGGGGPKWVKEKFEKTWPQILEQRWLRGSHADQAKVAAKQAKEAGQGVGAMRAKYGADALPAGAHDDLLQRFDAQIAARKDDLTPDFLEQFQKLRQAWFEKGLLRRSQGRPLTIDDLYEFIHGTPLDVTNPKSRRVGGLEQLVDYRKSRDLAQRAAGAVAEVVRKPFVAEMVRGKTDWIKVNKMFTLLADIRDITAQTAKRKVGQTGQVSKMYSVMVGMGLGSSAGYLMGGAQGAATGTIAGAATGVLARVLGIAGWQYLQSPQYAMAASGLKHRLANALADGKLDQARRVLDRMMAQTAAQATTGAQ